jgi:hypothetical protein
MLLFERGFSTPPFEQKRFSTPLEHKHVGQVSRLRSNINMMSGMLVHKQGIK